jgi:Putative antitoxin of bacterial toxin-antitoxin system, YdaS/YdaT
MSNALLFERVLTHFDRSPTKLAEFVKETTQTVCNWRRRGIPPHKVMALSLRTGISVRELRPDDWQEYWPEPTAAKRKPAKVPA